MAGGAGCGESLAIPERGRALDVAEGWALDVAGRGMRWLWRALDMAGRALDVVGWALAVAGRGGADAVCGWAALCVVRRALDVVGRALDMTRRGRAMAVAGRWRAGCGASHDAGRALALAE